MAGIVDHNNMILHWMIQYMIKLNGNRSVVLTLARKRATIVTIKPECRRLLEISEKFGKLRRAVTQKQFNILPASKNMTRTTIDIRSDFNCEALRADRGDVINH